jgi:hypothetical protein
VYPAKVNVVNDKTLVGPRISGINRQPLVDGVLSPNFSGGGISITVFRKDLSFEVLRLEFTLNKVIIESL